MGCAVGAPGCAGRDAERRGDACHLPVERVEPGDEGGIGGDPFGRRLGRENGVFIGGFGIELLLDLAHLGQAHDAAHSRRVETVFGG